MLVTVGKVAASVRSAGLLLTVRDLETASKCHKDSAYKPAGL